MTAGTLALACLADAVAGDPRWLPHPVKLMGLVITWCDERVRPHCAGPAAKRLAGIALAVGLPASAYALGWLAIELAGLVHDLLGRGMELFLAWTTLAARDLLDHGLAVQRALVRGSLPEARAAVALIVGRDTQALPEPEVVRATVETVAESASDGVVAPLLYLAIGGAPLALAYKAISTLDSMVGHLDERHRDFGWASAQLDDLANWMPARATGGLLVLAAGLVFRDLRVVRRAWHVLRRDGAKHPSPNSGRPEAAMAGALGVQLGGLNLYDGVPVERPVLGDPGPILTAAHVRLALTLLATVAVLAAGAAIGARLL
ncbi:MAG: adenosylcobinamide-phosphate synthase CbiB [Nitrospirota bacterium]